MNALFRLAVAALVLATLSVCAFGLRFAYDPAGLLALRDLMREGDRGEELQQLRRATDRRLQSRRQVVQEVIARRCSLDKALMSFRELDHEWPDYATPVSTPLRRTWPSDEERGYQRIRDSAQDLLSERPEEAAAALQRLEEDYRQLRAGRPTPSANPAERTGPAPLGPIVARLGGLR